LLIYHRPSRRSAAKKGVLRAIKRRGRLTLELSGRRRRSA
jgi:hypothetical protein